ncbi:MAG: UDP-N-acetylenolpyruvoylglucosamine reductase [Candidatus Sungbacteria bacterium RIFCSPLOWO2_02_FULL_51_17]|uniref:UDP-N-acetylenolpyruvoylglucosamine reductase n=1 Tax=Candidatus Sungbacteria bacterium RIFCSPHIGHO2_02_FULL_51_29 TaxID=1802273 RepID=A0A1G2KRT6_9BACT|nr:MAG: UDP-N-acetylenolpyruvoylglucosamine reductase [Candidatus Sungbacteria bacterium RIFCSPHIGHO2_01_FULL_51_22]OHA02100.1 MAG: UDP-N-acetylenolpyruvoylglucosamine reductase [Candidatus Sungbacteria bacterium RIFCSPHIGHO2_02_FULL_51_29]OHA06138.1 MAG: UDP-N-acetylenolpyruvoylglucosamine reductase [Candidatus Sungbacteria bacterium RIFCSPLOWO2_01_FULL_51_34]OHA10456.1 MAG: UDP-N-acetylenolpyruvoylglucosamine reductase [Candidatus Sungbacteria bacterium RIFCSPLOWO2_02_FULL_51_17]
MALHVQEHTLLAPYSVFRIGGYARFFSAVTTAADLTEAVAFAQAEHLPVFVLGAGSNVLISDAGFPGLVIKIELQHIAVHGTTVVAGAGAMLPRIVAESVKEGLAGFEWGIGIPGTIGGSVRGNAGSFGLDVGRVLRSVTALNVENGALREFAPEECHFGYRHSYFKDDPRWIVTEACLTLHPGDPDVSRETIRKYSMHRAATQDIGAKCAGCVFKNISWDTIPGGKDGLLTAHPELRQFEQAPSLPSAYLIDRAGLKGREFGHSRISHKHANFFINAGGATATEVKGLIGVAKREVKERFGVDLVEEVHIV